MNEEGQTPAEDVPLDLDEETHPGAVPEAAKGACRRHTG